MSEQHDSYQRSPELLDREASILLVVDMQEKLLPFIPEAEGLIRRCRKLINAAKLFSVPVCSTEQYPKGLGYTTPELKELLGPLPEKQRFSCAETLRERMREYRESGRDQFVLCGIESHVCVLQTAFDLMSAGFRVYVVADSVASRGKIDYEIALRRMSDAGATLVTHESVMFEWCVSSGDPNFKQISNLVKEN